MNEYVGGEANLLSVPEAARLLRVSESTVWRWIGGGLLRSYRLGRKRVYLQRADLAAALRERGGGTGEGAARHLALQPMAPGAGRGDPVQRALAFQERLCAKYGMRPGEQQAWEDVAEAREERSRALG